MQKNALMDKLEYDLNGLQWRFLMFDTKKLWERYLLYT